MRATQIKQAANFYKVLAHPVSVRVISLLQKRECKVRDIYNTLNMEQSATSAQLNKLAKVGAVNSRKEGRNKYYFVVRERLAKAEEAAQLVTF